MRHLNHFALVSASLATLALTGASMAVSIGVGQHGQGGGAQEGSSGSLNDTGDTRGLPSGPFGTPYGDDVYEPAGPNTDSSDPAAGAFDPSGSTPGSLGPDTRNDEPHIGDPYFGNPFGDDMGRGADTLPPMSTLDTRAGGKSKAKPGDLNRDGRIDANDLIGMVLEWGAQPQGNDADLNGDQFVDERDVADLFSLTWN